MKSGIPAVSRTMSRAAASGCGASFGKEVERECLRVGLLQNPERQLCRHRHCERPVVEERVEHGRRSARIRAVAADEKQRQRVRRGEHGPENQRALRVAPLQVVDPHDEPAERAEIAQQGDERQNGALRIRFWSPRSSLTT